MKNARVPMRLVFVVVDIKPKPFCPFCSVNWRTILVFPSGSVCCDRSLTCLEYKGRTWFFFFFKCNNKKRRLKWDQQLGHWHEGPSFSSPLLCCIWRFYFCADSGIPACLCVSFDWWSQALVRLQLDYRFIWRDLCAESFSKHWCKR